MHCVVPGVNAPDPQVSFERDRLCQSMSIDVMWPNVQIGKTWVYKCGSCGDEYHQKFSDDDMITCDRCGSDLRTPDWGARRKLQNLLDSALNGNGQRMRDIGNMLAQNLLRTGEAYLTRRGNYSGCFAF